MRQNERWEIKKTERERANRILEPVKKERIEKQQPNNNTS
jgi:predicted nucleotidyltransferase